MRKLLPVLAGLTLAVPVWAAGVTVTNAFARATPPGADTAAVYLSLRSDSDDALTGASTPVAASAMLHKTTMTGMVMSMDMIDQVLLPAGQTVALAPDQMHIMLSGLKTRLVKGTTIPLHLTFAHAPAQDVTIPVASLAATAPNN